jgi:leucyl-tRNA synthetase
MLYSRVMKRYDFAEIEKKWRREWADRKVRTRPGDAD